MWEDNEDTLCGWLVLKSVQSSGKKQQQLMCEGTVHGQLGLKQQ